jgi:hypothetical protein
MTMQNKIVDYVDKLVGLVGQEVEIFSSAFKEVKIKKR